MKGCTIGPYVDGCPACAEANRIIPAAPVTVEREKTHGDYAKSALLCQMLKGDLRSAMYPRSLAATQQEAAEMILFKLSRIACGNPNHADHWRDIAGYATLALKEIEKRNA